MRHHTTKEGADRIEFVLDQLGRDDRLDDERAVRRHEVNDTANACLVVAPSGNVSSAVATG